MPPLANDTSRARPPCATARWPGRLRARGPRRADSGVAGRTGKQQFEESGEVSLVEPTAAPSFIDLLERAGTSAVGRRARQSGTGPGRADGETGPCGWYSRLEAASRDGSAVSGWSSRSSTSTPSRAHVARRAPVALLQLPGNPTRRNVRLPSACVGRRHVLNVVIMGRRRVRAGRRATSNSGELYGPDAGAARRRKDQGGLCGRARVNGPARAPDP